VGDPFKLDPSVLSWLLDPSEPGPRYLALRDVLHKSKDDPEFVQACLTAHQKGPIAAILDKMDPLGFWERSGAGYNPKYRSTVWSLIFLAQLGASVKIDDRIQIACDYLIEQALCPGGQFSSNGHAPSSTVDCLQGNLCWALPALGYDHPNLPTAFEWMARTVSGEGIAPKSEQTAPVRFYAAKCGPNFACGANMNLPCAWGAVKVLLALAQIPATQRTPLMDLAIRMGVDFLFSVDPLDATYPSGMTGKPSPNWWKFGFPVFYVTDILQIVDALVSLGFGNDSRLEHILKFILDKRDLLGRWTLEYDYNGKTWVDLGLKKQPSKWVTLRALKVLTAINTNL